MMNPNNIFELIPKSLDKELVETLIQQGDVKIERIVSTGQSSPEFGWYDQLFAEWVMVLSGEAIIAFEGGEDCHLVAGSYLNIPAHTKHKVKWTSPTVETVWLTVHYPAD